MTTYAIDVDVKSVTDESDRATATLKFKSRAKKKKKRCPDLWQ